MNIIYTYPNLLKRIHSFSIDYTILFLILLLMPVLISNFQLNGSIKFSFLFIIPILIEPIFISFTGSSIGQKYHGLKVISKKTGKNLNIIQSIFRSILFLPMGIFSIITIFTTKKYQAIHDILSNSIVIVSDETKVQDYYRLSERVIYNELYNYPSKTRRTFIVLCYTIMLFLLYSFIIYNLLSIECFYHKKCNALESISTLTLTYSMIALFMTIIILGCKSNLFGARKIKKSVTLL